MIFIDRRMFMCMKGVLTIRPPFLQRRIKRLKTECMKGIR